MRGAVNVDIQAVEFQVRVENGVIAVPELYQEALDGEFIKVIVMKSSRRQTARNYIAEIMKNPIQFEGKPFKREEIYDHSL